MKTDTLHLQAYYDILSFLLKLKLQDTWLDVVLVLNIFWITLLEEPIYWERYQIWFQIASFIH